MALGKELETWMLFRKTFGKMQRVVEDDLRKYDTTPSQFIILRNLSIEESTPMSELSRKTSCVNSNITSVIGRMEEKGLVQKVQDTIDRRVSKVTLTVKGKELYDITVAKHDEYLVDILKCIPNDELETFNRLLYKLYSGIN
ncbi:DNA-binding transcriptional regulator, MarR family [Desulfonispora thiosulfatigenes DSM 11270]|uniref:DNA-binding transcriptional regulator, MarR family n=1 Tax=Desulfonispora thiosulfatigenes DSM 11270 TaxID=656914 RepID=A0A1W1VE78_DESTI|nr:MarR family transcriptional regulator [Desulfonispora thiosulfatigenes]SMB91361.1 DNA-binding transcriptional regulator, MarR family [Desulfonispora thiosulfatigenes DSM 11270]